MSGEYGFSDYQILSYPIIQSQPLQAYYSENDVANVNREIVQKIRAIRLSDFSVQKPAASNNNWLTKYSDLMKPQRPVVKSKPAKVKKAKVETVSVKNNNGKAQNVKLSADFVKRVKQIAKKINLEDYRDLLGVINSESGFSTTVRSGGKKDGAVGLIQFTDIAIRDLNKYYGLNLTKDKIAKMSAMEQLDLTEKYLLRAKSFRFSADKKLDSADLYAIVYRPAMAGKQVIATTADGSHYWENKGLDINKDGKITRNDLAQVVRNKWVNVIA